MGLKGLVILGVLGACTVAALAYPFAGIVAYVVHYHTGPESAWWGAGLAAAGVRYSLVISACLIVGTLLNASRQPYGRLLTLHEAFYLAFLAWLLAMGLIQPLQGAFFRGQALAVTDPREKMLKLTPFLLAMTHIVVTRRRLDAFARLLIVCGVYVGYECRTAPASYYIDGRLNGVGPIDARDSNMLAAHLLSLLPIVGVQFLRSGWLGKAFCLVAGAFIANGIVLTRSRGVYLAILVGSVAGLPLMPKGQRRKAIPLILLGAIGAGTLVDAKFMERMATLEGDSLDDDYSAQSRLLVWGVGLRMGLDNPLGVGPGNFASRVGAYLPDESGRDTHNTYIRCFAELGFPGAALLTALVVNAFITLARARRLVAGRPDLLDLTWHCYAAQTATLAYCIAATFVSATYLEMFWWLLLLPCSLERAVANALSEPPPEAGAASTTPGIPHASR